MVCFLILHYIVTNETIKCVDSINNNIEGDKKIIIVDNCSPNNSFIELQKYYKDNKNVYLIKSDKNLGFAKGNNFGYDYIKQNFNPDFIVVMNNDMEIFQKEFIKNIEDRYSETKFCVLGPDIYSTKYDYHQNPQYYNFPSLKSLKKRKMKLYLKNKLKFIIYLKSLLKCNHKVKRINIDKIDKVIYNPKLHGSCFILSRLFIDNNEYCFYPDTFMYMEAEIFCYQQMNKNNLLIYDPNIIVYHHEDVSTDAVFNKRYSKAIFTNKCLYDSTKAFIKLMESSNE